MMNFTELASVPSDRPMPFTDQPWLAVAAYLARFKNSSPLRVSNRWAEQSAGVEFITWQQAGSGIQGTIVGDSVTGPRPTKLSRSRVCPSPAASTAEHTSSAMAAASGRPECVPA